MVRVVEGGGSTDVGAWLRRLADEVDLHVACGRIIREVSLKATGDHTNGGVPIYRATIEIEDDPPKTEESDR